MNRETITIDCPACGGKVIRGPRRDAPHFPFCSERCRLVDLGKWFSGEHRIEEPQEGPGRDGGASSSED
jgi:endogenous inhibitor of DNA gyrase (YacG/DUF329 family)